MLTKMTTTGTLYSGVMRPRQMFLASQRWGIQKNAWCLQWNMVVAVSLCGAAWVLLVSGSCISLMASWIHKCTALYWKRRCYHHSVPLVVVHFSNMTMILNTHLRPLLDFWRRTKKNNPPPPKKKIMVTIIKHGICSKTVVIHMVTNMPKTWLLHFYYNKAMVHFHKGN